MSGSEANSCLTDAELHRLLDGNAPAADSAWAASHLEACDQCVQRMEAIAGAGTIPSPLRPWSPNEMEPAALRRVMDRLGAALPPTEPPLDNSEESDLALLGPPTSPGCIGRFGGLDILERVARGGMGIVFKARDRSLNRIVAVKVLAPALAMSAAAHARFLREARAAAAVVHENVVTIHAVGDERGLPYLVMQYVEGKPLSACLADGPMTTEKILRIGLQTALGLAAAHDQGLMHRDVKPGNILLEHTSDRVKLTDFGLARAADEPGLTKPGVVVGTPEYMAPEQIRGEGLDGRADLFSLGAVLYTLATCRSPFLADSTLATLRSVVEHSPPPPSQVNSGVPAWLSEIILRLLAKDPRDRFQSAREVAQALESRLTSLTPGAS